MKKVVTLLSIGLLLGACSSGGSTEEKSDSAERAKSGQNKVEQLRERKKKEQEEKEKADNDEDEEEDE